MYCYSNQELYEQREVTLKECQTVQPSVVESHFQQNSEYGQKAGFRYVFRFVGNHQNHSQENVLQKMQICHLVEMKLRSKNKCTDFWDGISTLNTQDLQTNWKLEAQVLQAKKKIA